MHLLLLLAAAPPPLPPPLPSKAPPENAARRIVDWQLQSPPRIDAELSAEEATRVRQRYLESIGQRVEQAPEQPR
ncbi:hypothetical protein [Sphingobium sp.]|uniref:hypothetical protein n=1 Tax=Sphingobium sp. TaxID=1912891 RepID=UPI0028BF4068|nr:hypothetical protein [Sphingobium sp.]